MLRKRRRGVIATAAVSVMALLAISGVAAGSAQAEGWHVNGKAFNEGKAFYGHNQHIFTIDLYSNSGKDYFTSIRCEGEIQYGEAYSLIWNGSNLKMQWNIHGCSVPSMPKCIVTAAPTKLNYNGTGASGTVTQTGEYFQTEAEVGCELPAKTKMTFNAPFSFTYPEPEQAWLVFKGSGTGKFGALTTKVATIGSNVLVSNPLPWGWY